MPAASATAERQVSVIRIARRKATPFRDSRDSNRGSCVVANECEYRLFDADYGRLLEAVYGKWVTSPAG